MTQRATVVADGALAALAVILGGVGLPQDDLVFPDRTFWLFEDDEGPVGCGGLEGKGRDRLLRSVAVVASRQGTGAGSEIVTKLEAAARAEGVCALHLLTTGSRSFFERLGYTPAERSTAPGSIATTQQFTTLCPSSATYMTKELA